MFERRIGRQAIISFAHPQKRQQFAVGELAKRDTPHFKTGELRTTDVGGDDFGTFSQQGQCVVSGRGNGENPRSDPRIQRSDQNVGVFPAIRVADTIECRAMLDLTVGLQI